RLQQLEGFATGTFKNVVAQLRRETRDAREGEQRKANVFALPFKHFALYVVTQQLRAGNEPFAQCLLIRIKQYEADPGQPAFTASQQQLEAVLRQFQPVQLEQLSELIAGQG